MVNPTMLKDIIGTSKSRAHFPTLKERLLEMIDETVIMLNEPVLDDMYPDLLADGDKRSEAIDYIIDRLIKIQEDGE